MAPTRSAPTRRSRSTAKNNKRANNDQDEASQGASLESEEKPFLLLDDVTCKICLEIMIKPVSLPCKHNLCFSCYESCVEKANLACPMCRRRISVWCRQASKTNTLVNEALWQRIQSQYPDRIKSVSEGAVDDRDPEECNEIRQL